MEIEINKNSVLIKKDDNLYETKDPTNINNLFLHTIKNNDYENFKKLLPISNVYLNDCLSLTLCCSDTHLDIKTKWDMLKDLLKYKHIVELNKGSAFITTTLSGDFNFCKELFKTNQIHNDDLPIGLHYAMMFKYHDIVKMLNKNK